MINQWRFEDHQPSDGGTSRRVMAVAGITAGGLGGRFVAFGSNPMNLRMMNAPNVSESMDILLFNAIK